MRWFASLLACLLAASAHAQFGVSWRHEPAIVVIGAADDPRAALVDEALAYWNGVLQEIGTDFRLRPARRIDQPIPEAALQSLSSAIAIDRQGLRASVPPELRGLPGDLTILLAQSDFISFAGPFDPDGKRVIGIKGAGFFPLSLPNVARNVIAHELGHAIGLRHNADPALLMCGRPAPCRPDTFRSREARFFPLSAEERRQLAQLYPPRRLCADDPRNSTAREIRNDDKRTVAELLGIADPDPRAHEILAARPRVLSPFINWAEGIQPGMQWIKTDRIDAAGYQVCVRDAKGSYWYFRNVPGDLWQTGK